MTIKSKKNRLSKKLRGGSSSLKQIRSSIKERMGFKRISDKHCNKEIDRLSLIFEDLNSAYKILEKAHKKVLREVNNKKREYQSEIESERPNNNRISVRQEVVAEKVNLVNFYRNEMNNIYLLVKRLRCVLIKYFYTKIPEHLIKLFEEYSEIFNEIKKKNTKMSKIIDLALIKECFSYYMDNRDKKNYKFVLELGRILRLSSDRSKMLYKANKEKLRSMLAEHCLDKKDDEIIAGHHLKYFELYEFDSVTQTRNNIAASETTNSRTNMSLVTMTNASVYGKKKSSQNKHKGNKSKAKLNKKSKKKQLNMF